MFLLLKAEYFGNLKRHHSLQKDLLDGKVEDTKPRGKPGTNWEGNIKIWSGVRLQECTSMAENRDGWKYVAINLRTGRRYLDR